MVKLHRSPDIRIQWSPSFLNRLTYILPKTGRKEIPLSKLRWSIFLIVISLFILSCSGEPQSTDPPDPAATETAGTGESVDENEANAAPTEIPGADQAEPSDAPEESERGGNSQIEDEERLASLTEVTTFLNGLPAEDAALDNQSIADHLTERPEFRNAGVSDDGTVWAEFTDGRLFLIFNNRPIGLDEPPASSLSSSPAGVPIRTPLNGYDADKEGLSRADSLGKLAAVPLAEGVSGGLPAGDGVRLLWAMGTFYESLDHREDLASWFTASNYRPMKGAGTVEDLKQVSGDGVFYFGSHGGAVRNIEGTKVTAIWTSTPVDGFNETLLKNDIDAGRVVYAAAPHDKNPAFIPGIDPPGKKKLHAVHYGITGDFVTKYMSFGSNSLVIVDACSSDDSSLRQAFLDKGASVYAGWTTTVRGGYADKAIRFLFDRLLGTNKEGDEPFPKQRPFDYVSILENMGEEGLLPACTATGCPAGTTTLNFTPGRGDFALLMPSIAYMEVEEASDELFIHGMFGSEEGIVTIDDNKVDVKNWTPETVSVKLVDEGSGSAGDVVVEVGDHPSNSVPLTEWRGELHYRFQADALSPNLAIESTMEIHLRADVHAYRDKPGHDPVERQVEFTLAGDSTGNFTASGTADLEGSKLELSGEGELPVEENQPDHELAHFFITGKLLPQGILEGKPPMIVESDIHLHLDSDNTLLTITLPGFGTRESGFALNPTDVLFDQSFELDENFNIEAGRRTATGLNGVGGLGSGELDWGDLTAFHAPRLDKPPHANLPGFADGVALTY